MLYQLSYGRHSFRAPYIADLAPSRQELNTRSGQKTGSAASNLGKSVNFSAYRPLFSSAGMLPRLHEED